ncbi:MAG: MGMT family protein [Ignavibacteriales bacterium]|nr:MGMT family protein [Ignavibacteriales bacterium]
MPYGKTASYKDIAVKIKNPAAVRAIGQANGANPLPIIIPCHRVINADGSIGGYSGGLDVKRKLFAVEGITLTKI